MRSLIGIVARVPLCTYTKRLSLGDHLAVDLHGVVMITNIECVQQQHIYFFLVSKKLLNNSLLS